LKINFQLLFRNLLGNAGHWPGRRFILRRGQQDTDSAAGRLHTISADAGVVIQRQSESDEIRCRAVQFGGQLSIRLHPVLRCRESHVETERTQADGTTSKLRECAERDDVSAVRRRAVRFAEGDRAVDRRQRRCRRRPDAGSGR
jgi:hypothetical protein